MAKSYSMDLRKRVFQQIKKGTSITDISRMMDISRNTIHSCVHLKDETGKLEPRKRKVFIPKKFSDQRLEKYIAKHPSSTLLEIGNHFQVTPQTIFYRFKKLKITRKKNDVIF